jgi:hypothetical protein
LPRDRDVAVTAVELANGLEGEPDAVDESFPPEFGELKYVEEGEVGFAVLEAGESWL